MKVSFDAIHHQRDNNDVSCVIEWLVTLRIIEQNILSSSLDFLLYMSHAASPVHVLTQVEVGVEAIIVGIQVCL